MKFIKLLIICFVLPTITSCSSDNQPKNIVENYLTAIDSFNFKNAEQLIIPNSENLKTIVNIKTFSNEMTKAERESYINTKKVYSYKEIDVTDYSAKVIVTSTQENFPVYIEFYLIKEKDKWLIDKIESNL